MARRVAVTLVMFVTAVLSASGTLAHAQGVPLEEDPAQADRTRAAVEDDPTFGPRVTIERIDVVGNVITADRLIRRALLVQEGDVLRSGDPRFRRSRFRVIALGYFVDVQIRLDRGAERGKVVLTVEVWERGTFILNRVFLGASELTPLWLGLDVGDGNFLGTGLTVSGAFVWAKAADVSEVEGAEEQWALRLRYGDPSIFGLPLAGSAAFLYNRASEPERRAAPPVGEPDAPANFTAFSYRRAGGIAGVGWDVTRQISLLADARLELVDADASTSGWLLEGESRVATLGVGLERDTRADPVLPQSGGYALAYLEAGGVALGGDYGYARARARWQHWFPLRGERHVFSLAAGVGAVFGDAPGFDRLHVSDFDRLLPPRPLDLSVSTQRPLDVFGKNSSAPRYGTFGAIVELEYRYRLFRRTRLIYGGDLFIGAGVFALSGPRPTASAGASIQLDADRAFDLTFDLGLRLDTEVGIFELSFANGLGRIPL